MLAAGLLVAAAVMLARIPALQQNHVPIDEFIDAKANVSMLVFFGFLSIAIALITRKTCFVDADGNADCDITLEYDYGGDYGDFD
jgi:hypothetical protein